MTPDELSARGIRVKPLVWRWLQAGGWEAPAPNVNYQVVGGPPYWVAFANFKRLGNGESPELAQAAAQAHHDARVADQLELMEADHAD